MTEHWANFYFGIPYQLGGRDPDLGGLDCWGVLYDANRRFRGVELPLYAGAPNEPEHAEVESFMRGEVSKLWKRTTRPQEWDGVWLFVHGRVCHVGVMIDDSDFITMFSTGVVRRSVRDWERRVEGVYRYVGPR